MDADRSRQGAVEAKPDELMANLDVEQARVLSIRQRDGVVQAEQARALAVYNVPAEGVSAVQARVLNLFQRPVTVEVPQARVLAIYAGRTADPRIQVWASQLDLHEKYYLRLGDALTLVYDTYSGEWVEYGHGISPFWRVSTGMNWLGANPIASLYGSNIVVGDDVTNMLYLSLIHI